MRPQRSPFAFIAPHLRFNDDPPPPHPYLPSFQTRHPALAALVPDGWRPPQRPSDSGSANHVDSRDQWGEGCRPPRVQPAPLRGGVRVWPVGGSRGKEHVGHTEERKRSPARALKHVLREKVLVTLERVHRADQLLVGPLCVFPQLVGGGGTHSLFGKAL